ncbi:hypothetical protein NEAUS03_1788 [Nematocida ausubeli]|nr:hypothetical protein NEAUS03_1788 [Nematocida ausubeli]KAI5186962.1 hypothetical protein NEIRO03_2428 [Nematocida sp. AWRm78]
MENRRNEESSTSVIVMGKKAHKLPENAPRPRRLSSPTTTSGCGSTNTSILTSGTAPPRHPQSELLRRASPGAIEAADTDQGGASPTGCRPAAQGELRHRGVIVE